MRITRVQIIISFVVALLLQPMFGALLGLDNFGPNLLLCIASIIIVIADDSILAWGMILATSLIYDVAFSPVLGMATAGIIVSLLLILLVKYFFYLDNILLVPILAAIDTVGYNLTCWFVSKGIGGAYTFGYVLKYTALDLIGYLIVIFALFLCFRKYIEKHRNDIKAF